MKRKFVLLPIALAAFTPTMAMVGCAKPEKITINLVNSICGSVKTNSLSIVKGIKYVKTKKLIDKQAQPNNGCKFTYWSSQNNEPIAEDHVFVDGETIIAHFETLQECLNWSFNEDMTAVLTGFSSEGQGMTELVIPSVIESSGTYTVTTIRNSCFSHCTGLTKVEIPDSIKFINDFAFDTCTGLTDLIIGSGVEIYHEGAFEYCTALTKITLGPRVNTIDGMTFCNCSNLLDVDLTALTTPPVLGPMSFDRCHKDLTFVVAKGMSSIFKNAEG